MKNTIVKNRYSRIFIKIFSTVMLAALTLIIVQSCGKGDTTQPSAETVSSSGNDNAVTTTIIKINNNVNNSTLTLLWRHQNATHR